MAGRIKGRDPKITSEGKVCSKCAIWKTRENFHLYSAAKSKMRSACKVCLSKPRTKFKMSKEEALRRNHERTKRKKEKLVRHYSKGTMKCESCGFSDIRALNIDRIDNSGHEHRKTVDNVYDWLIRENFPEGFAVLCSNCNWKKHLRQSGYLNYTKDEE